MGILVRLWRKLTYREGTWYITKNGRVYYNWERWNPPSIRTEEWFSEPSDS